MKKINYIFHIGERCNIFSLLKYHKLLSAYNPFSGLYISFNNSIKLINNKFVDFTENIIDIYISKKEYKFINKSKDYDDLDCLIKNNLFNFFGKENSYKDGDYSINLNYTNIDNFKINDLYYWDDFCIMPGLDYSNEIIIQKYIRRKDRFLNCLQMNNPNNILLIYQAKLMKINNILDHIEYVKKIYNLEYNLFYIIPIENTNDKYIDIINFNNITFYLIQFPAFEKQLVDNPGDDNGGMYFNMYQNIVDKIRELYEIDLIDLFN